MKLAAQIALVLLTCLGFFQNLRRDFHGRPAAAPGGFTGAVGTVIAVFVVALLYTLAGAFSELLTVTVTP